MYLFCSRKILYSSFLSTKSIDRGKNPCWLFSCLLFHSCFLQRVLKKCIIKKRKKTRNVFVSVKNVTRFFCFSWKRRTMTLFTAAIENCFTRETFTVFRSLFIENQRQMSWTCLFINVLHVCKISDEYFHYEVTTNIRIEMPEIVEFPSVTLSVIEMKKGVECTQENCQFVFTTEWNVSQWTFTKNWRKVSQIILVLTKITCSDGSVALETELWCIFTGRGT